jgi:hypothetical protein
MEKQLIMKHMRSLWLNVQRIYQFLVRFFKRRLDKLLHKLMRKQNLRLLMDGWKNSQQYPRSQNGQFKKINRNSSFYFTFLNFSNSNTVSTMRLPITFFHLFLEFQHSFGSEGEGYVVSHIDVEFKEIQQFKQFI